MIHHYFDAVRSYCPEKGGTEIPSLVNVLNSLLSATSMVHDSHGSHSSHHKAHGSASFSVSSAPYVATYIHSCIANQKSPFIELYQDYIVV